ncbi:MAG: glycosyltransferase family 4 protein [Acidimicrobiia bacterium]
MNYRAILTPGVVGANVCTLVTRPRRYGATLLEVLRHNRRHLPFLLKAAPTFVKAVAYARDMEKAGVDHVHCHFATHPALAGLVIHRLTGIPYSFTAHGSDLHVNRTMLDRKAAAAAFVVTVSEFNAEVLRGSIAQADAARVAVVHCGVDTAEYVRPDERATKAQAPATADPLRVICVGTLHEVKGQSVLLRACARARRRGRDVRCTVVGGGPDEDKLRSLIGELDLHDHVELLGPLARDEVRRRVVASDVLVAPSIPTSSGKREGIPVALMEGMAAGLAVIASRLTGIPELVLDERCGLLVEPGCVDELADALERLADDPRLRRRLGDEARRWVAREFDLESNAARLLELIGSRG